MKVEKGVRIVVSGGASGLGRAVVEQFAAAQARVVVLDLNEAAGRSLGDTWGANLRFVCTDVTAEPSVDAAVRSAHDWLGGIDAVVNCAGIAPARRVLAKDGLMTTADYTRVIQINLIGTFCMCRAAADVMQHNTPDANGQRGVIINTASIAAFDGQIGQAAYSASKAGIVGMTLPLAREFARIGVRVMTIAPGLFRTPLFDTLPAKAVADLEASTPFPKRLGNPPEFAALVAHIIENPMLNGETIRLDGALRM